MKKFKIALDIDEVLSPCLERACQMLGIDTGRITDWNLQKSDLSEAERNTLLMVMNSPDFVRSQVLYPGAAVFVQALLDMGHEVLLASAVTPASMGSRIEMLSGALPMLKPENIMLGARKELLTVDFLLDDSPYNCGHARYFVLMDRWYNRGHTGFLRVHGYDEFLDMVRAAAAAPDEEHVRVGAIGHPGIICLVGPSASGKSFICDELEKHPLFRKVRAMTDRPVRGGEIPGKEYIFVSPQEFQAEVKSGGLLENTLYAGHHYGISAKEIEAVWAEGRIAIKPVDVSGANAIREAYPDRTLVLFVRRDKKALLHALIERDCPADDKVDRILSLDSEYANESQCDWTIFNNGSLSHAVEQVLQLI